MRGRHVLWEFSFFDTNELELTIDLISKYHNVPVPYPTMHHSEQKCAHFCSEWCIVGRRTSGRWYLWDCFFRPHVGLYYPCKVTPWIHPRVPYLHFSCFFMTKCGATFSAAPIPHCIFACVLNCFSPKGLPLCSVQRADTIWFHIYIYIYIYKDRLEMCHMVC